jgi:hypothetical protein
MASQTSLLRSAQRSPPTGRVDDRASQSPRRGCRAGRLHAGHLRRCHRVLRRPRRTVAGTAGDSHHADPAAAWRSGGLRRSGAGQLAREQRPDPLSLRRTRLARWRRPACLWLLGSVRLRGHADAHFPRMSGCPVGRARQSGSGQAPAGTSSTSSAWTRVSRSSRIRRTTSTGWPAGSWSSQSS